MMMKLAKQLLGEFESAPVEHLNGNSDNKWPSGGHQDEAKPHRLMRRDGENR